MIVVIDYGVGNLHSVHKAIEYVGGKAVVASDAETILKADKVILPGVGAFKDGMDGLRKRELIPVIKQVADSKKPLLGICLGMQLLFEESVEKGEHKGLGLLSGQVLAFQNPGLRTPHIGWNQIEQTKQSPLLGSIPRGAYVYFNHSYYCESADNEHIIAITDYGSKYVSAVWKKNIFGVQFHPEKSQKVGLQILQNFVEQCNG